MKPERWMGLLAVLVVIAGVVLAFRAMGSPGHTRSLTLDQLRVNGLSESADALRDAYESEHTDLPRVPGTRVLKTDPVTTKPYEYHRIDERHYTLCARFDAANETGFAFPQGDYSDRPGHFKHGAGRTCYRFDVTNKHSEPQLVRSAAGNR